MTDTTKPTVKENLLAMVKSKSYWGGVARYTLMPILKAVADGTDNQFDDVLYKGAEQIIDAICGPATPVTPPTA